MHGNGYIINIIALLSAGRLGLWHKYLFFRRPLANPFSGIHSSSSPHSADFIFLLDSFFGMAPLYFICSLTSFRVLD